MNELWPRAKSEFLACRARVRVRVVRVVPVLEDDKDEDHEADRGEERAHGDAHPEHHDPDREQ